MISHTNHRHPRHRRYHHHTHAVPCRQARNRTKMHRTPPPSSSPLTPTSPTSPQTRRQKATRHPPPAAPCRHGSRFPEVDHVPPRLLQRFPATAAEFHQVTPLPHGVEALHAPQDSLRVRGVVVVPLLIPHQGFLWTIRIPIAVPWLGLGTVGS